MAVLDIIGFETGDGKEFASVVSGATQTTTKRSGAYAAQDYVTAVTRSWTGQATAVARFAFRFGSSSPSADTSIFAFYDAGSNPLGVVAISTGRKLIAQAFGGTANAGSTTLATGTWYVIEVRYTKGTGSNASIETRIDGVAEISSTDGTATADTTFAAFTGVAAQIGTYYFDDIRIDSGSTWIGLGRINALRPNAVGDEDNWTGTFADIDDEPQNDATYRQAPASGSTPFLSNLTPTSGFDVTPGTINHSKIVARAYRAGSGATKQYYLRSKKSGGSAENSANLSWTTTVATYVWVPTTQPVSASELDSWQIGADQNTAGGRVGRVTELYLMVDYDEFAAPTAAIRDVIGRGVVPFAR